MPFNRSDPAHLAALKNECQTDPRGLALTALYTAGNDTGRHGLAKVNHAEQSIRGTRNVSHIQIVRWDGSIYPYVGGERGRAYLGSVGPWERFQADAV